MADLNRRKGGVRSQQSYMQQQAGASQQQFSAYQHQLHAQQSPYQYQSYLQQQNKRLGFQPNRGSTYNSPTTARPTAQKSVNMGIKSGMTVEDLKRLTQKRMQSAASNPAIPKASTLESGSTARPPPKMNVTVVNSTSPPAVPKTGMSVQELKQLTALRVASQNVPVHASEVTGLVSKAVLTNAAKSHYRDSLRSSLTPGNTPKRSNHTRTGSSQFGGPQFNGFWMDDHNHGPGETLVRGQRSRSHSSQLPLGATSQTEAPLRYSYTGDQTPQDFISSYEFGGDNSSSQESDTGSMEEVDSPSHNATLQFREDSFPPPPPMDEDGGFVATALPSWSPPPTRSKKLNASSGATFYNQQTSYYNIASKDDATSSTTAATEIQDQNAVIAPPPGLTRRPSMTVPWQVAEAVLNTPQTNTGRKKLLDSDGKSNSGALNSSAAEAAAQLTGLSLQPSARTKSSASGQSSRPTSSPSGTLSNSPSTAQFGGTSVTRRGSFGNAAEFFKFRRRSKSRLELARDMPFGENSEIGGYQSYGAAGAMPGIAERRGDAEDEAHDDSASGASSSTSANDESSSQDYSDEDVVQVTGGYDDTMEISGSFVSFYNAARQQPSGLSIPPPPPPPRTDDEDNASTTSSTKGNGLPMMSPNGARLRKVAELARRGSLSSEDKTRAKDEIIQSSLGIGANNAARLFATKKEDQGDRVPAAPPGFHGMPRLTPKTTSKKILGPGSGIVRSTTAGTTAVSSGASLKPESGSNSVEERLAAAAQQVADCVGKGDMTGFQQAMDELDRLRNEASKLMRG